MSLRVVQKASLLTKLVVRYYEATPAKSSYQKAIPADFKRRKDELYLMMGNDMKRIPTKKKDFYTIFGEILEKVTGTNSGIDTSPGFS